MMNHAATAWALSLIMLGALLGLSVQAAGEVVVYPAPEGAPLASGVTLTADDKPVPVYELLMRNSKEEFSYDCQFATFDFSGEAKVVLKGASITSAKVRPLSLGVTPVVADNAVTFTLKRPVKVQVEVNGDRWQKTFFLFANAPEASRPKADDPNVRYFGPGLHKAGTITLQSGQTLYIAGGAVVEGNVRATGAKDIKVLGRGILLGRNVAGRWLENAAIYPRECTGVQVRGIIIADFPSWTCVPYMCDEVVFDDVKILTGRKGGTDGIDIVSCRKVTVNDCFIKCLDDCIPIKALPPAKGREAGDITITRCVLWNVRAGAVEIGYETNCETIRNVLVKDCDLLFSEAGTAALTIHDSNYAHVQNVRFEDIRCEYEMYLLPNKGFMWGCMKPFEFRNVKGQWGGEDRRGAVTGVVVKDFTFLANGFAESDITGADAEHPIEGVTFENLRMGGRLILDAKAGKIKIGENVKDVRFVEK